MHNPLLNKRAVVTGSSLGIGRATAMRLALEGARVIVNGSGSVPGALEAVVADIAAAGGTAIAVSGSVSDPEVGKLLIDTCVSEFGGIDILVNVAGIVEPVGSSILNISLEDWKRQIDVHLHGSFYTCRFAAPIMAAQKYGVIINTGSHAFTGVYGSTGYAAAKGATYSLTYALAKSLAEYGVRVNAVCPGAKTRMSTGEDYEATIHSLNARGLLDDVTAQASLNPEPPELVAALYAWLASDASAPVTGKIFSAAGGYVGMFMEPNEKPLAFRNVAADGGWTLEALSVEIGKLLGVSKPAA